MKYRCLIVDDEPLAREILVQYISDCPSLELIKECSDAIEAGEYLHTHQADLIFLDINMPKMDGREALKQIKAHPQLRRIPVVILTTSREEQDVAQSYDLGANSYIRKPVNFNQFAEAVRQLGLYWLVLNEPPPGSPGRPGGA